jgi:GGDEF domain-containing protein
VADRLRGAVRETDTVVRLGGDRFAILHQVTVGISIGIVAPGELVRSEGEIAQAWEMRAQSAA